MDIQYFKRISQIVHLTCIMKGRNTKYLDHASLLREMITFHLIWSRLSTALLKQNRF